MTIEYYKQLCQERLQDKSINQFDREIVEELYESLFNKPDLTCLDNYFNRNRQQVDVDVQDIDLENTRSSIEDPVKKCNTFLSHLDGTCDMPNYILQFLELVGELLEEDAKIELARYKKTQTQEQYEQILSKYCYRKLPICMSTIQSQTVHKDKRLLKGTEYAQINKNYHSAYIYKFQTIKEFKQYCQSVNKRLHPRITKTEYASVDRGEFPKYTHAFYGDQDFRYLPLMYKTVYQLDTPTFTPNDREQIKTFYKKYSDLFQDLRKSGQCYNIKKLFIVIQQYIETDPILLAKYKPLSQYIIGEIRSTHVKNSQIFTDIYEKIRQNEKQE